MPQLAGSLLRMWMIVKMEFSLLTQQVRGMLKKSAQINQTVKRSSGKLKETMMNMKHVDERSTVGMNHTRRRRRITLKIHLPRQKQFPSPPACNDAADQKDAGALHSRPVECEYVFIISGILCPVNSQDIHQ